MKKKFSEITDDERKAVLEWSLNSDKIKNAMWGRISNTKAKKEAVLLTSMFEKYDSNVDEGTILYRGRGVTDSEWDKVYKDLKRGETFCPDEKAITSFTKSIDIAHGFAFSSIHKYKIVLKNKSNGENMFDVSSIAADPSEEETIFSNNL